MTYPPTSPGYPAPQQPAGYGAGPGAPAAQPGPRRVPAYLAGAVLAFGLLAYLASFGPQLRISTDMGPFGGAQLTASGLSYWTVAALIAALLAGVSLLPKVASYAPVVAALAVLGVLLVVGQIFNSPAQFSIGWGMWLGLTLTVLQAAAALAALLIDSGVISAPAPRPRYEQYGQYGPPPSYYPGAPGGQRPGYPSQYAGYPPGPAAGGNVEDTHTPPTGFPGYQPPSGTGYQPQSGAGYQPPSGPDLRSPSGQPPAESGPAAGPTPGSTSTTP